MVMAQVTFKTLNIDALAAHVSAPCDIFVRLDSGKLARWLCQEDLVADADLSKLRDKGYAHIYVRTDDYTSHFFKKALPPQVAGFVLDFALKEEMLEAMIGLRTPVYQALRDLGFQSEHVEQTQIVCDQIWKFASQHSVLQPQIERLLSLSPESARHALLVSSLCVVMGLITGWSDSTYLQYLALGGLLHDIGKLRVPKDILQKNLVNMSFDEKIIYQTHIENASDILSKQMKAASELVQMVVEHHELADGSGFPLGKKDRELSPAGRICSLANAFSEMIIKTDHIVSGKALEKVVDDLSGKRASHFNFELLQALVKVLKTNLAKAEA